MTIPRRARGTVLRFAVVAALSVSSACGPAPGDGSLHVFAAASLAPALETVGPLLEERTGRPMILVTAATSSLARQIERGAPADVFLSADRRWVDWLAHRGRLTDDAPRDVLGGDLVVIAPAGVGPPPAPGIDWRERLTGRVAVADPEHVPAGRYAREAMERAGVWDDVSGRLVAARDARAALALVERAECETGIVYATDAASADRVRVIARVPSELHVPIRYVAAIPAGADVEAARAWLDAFSAAAVDSALASLGYRRP